MTSRRVHVHRACMAWWVITSSSACIEHGIEDHQARACRMCGILTRVVQILLRVHMKILMEDFRALVRY